MLEMLLVVYACIWIVMGIALLNGFVLPEIWHGIKEDEFKSKILVAIVGAMIVGFDVLIIGAIIEWLIN